MKTLMTAILSLVGVIFGGYILLFWLALYRIAHTPLPPVPDATPRYTVYEAGTSETIYIGWKLWPVNARLSASGNVEMLDSQKLQQQEKQSERIAASLAAKYQAETSGIQLANSDGRYLVRDNAGFVFKRGHQVIKSVPYKINGYTWKPICHIRFTSFGKGNSGVGYVNIATACASSGGTSSPHGRNLALLWQGNALYDLNSQINPSAGWYLEAAVDINERGQILCLGRKGQANITSAESNQQANENYWLVLTPQ